MVVILEICQAYRQYLSVGSIKSFWFELYGKQKGFFNSEKICRLFQYLMTE